MSSLQDILTPIIFSLGTIGVFWSIRFYKIKKASNIILIKNCLLTKSPILIFGEKISLFNLRNSFRFFYLLFQQHGYETYLVQLSNQRKSSYIKKLDEYENQNLKFHFFLSKNGFEMMKSVLKNRNYSCVRSINEIEFSNPLKTLQKAVCLAEEDFW